MRRGTSFGIPTELEVELARADRRAHAARRDAALRVERHRGDDERGSPRARGDRSRRRSSSSTAAITATPIRFSCAPAPASRRSVCRTRPACPTRSRRSRSSRRSTISTRSSVCCATHRRRGDHRRAGRRQRRLHRARSGVSSRACARSPTSHGALLIFDEVMTGFRIALGGARERFGVDGRSHDARQGDRRRTARRGVWRTSRSDGADRAVGPRVSGGNAVGQSAGDGGGHRDAQRAHARAARRDRARARRDSCRACARSPRDTAFRSPRTAPDRCGDSSFAPSRCDRSPTRRRRTSSGSSGSFTRRSIAACISRRRRSRRRSCRPRTRDADIDETLESARRRDGGSAASDSRRGRRRATRSSRDLAGVATASLAPRGRRRAPDGRSRPDAPRCR